MTEENGKQERPGFVGNRFAPGNKLSKGRPKGVRTIPEVLRRLCEEKVQIGGKKASKLEVIMMKVLAEAVHGKSWAVQFVAERLEGKALQRSEVKTETVGKIDHEAVKRQILTAAAEIQAWEAQKKKEPPEGGPVAKSG
jgi:hypothetical protein